MTLPVLVDSSKPIEKHPSGKGHIRGANPVDLSVMKRVYGGSAKWKNPINGRTFKNRKEALKDIRRNK